MLAGDELHIAHDRGQTNCLLCFRVSTHRGNADTYPLTDELVAGPITYEEQSVALEVLSDGRVRCFYARTVGYRDVYTAATGWAPTFRSGTGSKQI